MATRDMTTAETLAAIDLVAARDAVSSISATIDSMAFTAPELMGDRLSAVADRMNALAVALCLTNLKGSG